MDQKAIFNATVCILGVLILLLHIVNILLKKNRRKDENSLLSFFIFTAIHFATYFTFVLIKEFYTSDSFIIAFYTVFYIMNNIEVILFYNYMSIYSNVHSKAKRIVDIVNIVLFSAFIISDIVNIFTHIYFTSVNGVYTRSSLMILSQGYQFVVLLSSFIIIVMTKSLSIREKIAFGFYCILPAVSIIIQNALPGYAIAYLALFISIEILFLFLNVEKNIRLEEDEKKLHEANIRIMMSQIQPHFIYNTLSSISTLITMNPYDAQKALDDFTDYLRANFSALTQTKLVSFRDELMHIKTYANLEKHRFNDRLNMVYDIQVIDFPVPPLTIQPLVENAIKHGILKKIEGGTVTLRTYEDENAYYVEIEDDGVGFDMEKIDFSNNKHIGLNNVRHRLKSMCKGDIVFSSQVGKGTKVVVTFEK
ncbi:MAG: hypothetical protein E7181_04880 [Erysipelotrichaceae bacterium]|nr:hypothetical protein [Erysipelotrichaceae bacterium]